MKLPSLTKRKIKKILDRYFDNILIDTSFDKHYKLEEENSFLDSKSCINYIITLKTLGYKDDESAFLKEKEFKIKIPKSTKSNKIREKIRQEFKEQLFYNRNASQLVRYLIDIDEFYDNTSHQGVPRELLIDALAETIVKFSKIKYCDDYDNINSSVLRKELMPRFLKNKEHYFIPLNQKEGVTIEIAIDIFQDYLELAIEELFGIYNFCLPTKPLL